MLAITSDEKNLKTKLFDLMLYNAQKNNIVEFVEIYQLNQVDLSYEDCMIFRHACVHDSFHVICFLLEKNPLLYRRYKDFAKDICDEKTYEMLEVYFE